AAEEGIHHGRQSDDTGQVWPSRYARACAAEVGGRSRPHETRGRGYSRRPREPDHQASQKRRAHRHCRFWHPAGQGTRSPHGAKSGDRRSYQNKGEQEGRVPPGQALEDGNLVEFARTPHTSAPSASANRAVCLSAVVIEL